MEYQVYATIDVAVKICSFHNLNSEFKKSRCFSCSVYSDGRLAIPYQTNKNTSKSSINLIEYRSSVCSFWPKSNVSLNQIILFRIDIPLSKLCNTDLTLKFELFQIQFQSLRTIQMQQYKLNNILNVKQYFPIIFQKQNLAIDGVIYSQILKFRFNNIYRLSNNVLLQIISMLNVGYNKVKNKISNQNDSFSTNFKQTISILEQQQVNQDNRKQNIDFVYQFIQEITIKIYQKWKQIVQIFQNQSHEQLKQHFFANNAFNIKQNQTYKQIKIENYQKKQINEFHKGNRLQTDHFVFLVHGYGATSFVMQKIQSNLSFFFPNLILKSSRINEQSNNYSLQQLSRRLSQQVISIIKDYKPQTELNISFITHSLGGLVVRNCLKYLKQYQFNMRLFVSLATPHLGHLFHSSLVNKFGMWCINKFSKSNILGMLLMQAKNKDYRALDIYQLSTSPNLGWFQQVIMYGCQNDKFVSLQSSLCLGKNQIYTEMEKNDQKAIIYVQMLKNINKSFENVGLQKYNINFGKNEKRKTLLKEDLIGKTQHLNFCNSQSFIEYMIIANYHLFL